MERAAAGRRPPGGGPRRPSRRQLPAPPGPAPPAWRRTPEGAQREPRGQTLCRPCSRSAGGRAPPPRPPLHPPPPRHATWDRETEGDLPRVSARPRRPEPRPSAQRGDTPYTHPDRQPHPRPHVAQQPRHPRSSRAGAGCWGEGRDAADAPGGTGAGKLMSQTEGEAARPKSLCKTPTPGRLPADSPRGARGAPFPGPPRGRAPRARARSAPAPPCAPGTRRALLRGRRGGSVCLSCLYKGSQANRARAVSPRAVCSARASGLPGRRGQTGARRPRGRLPLAASRAPRGNFTCSAPGGRRRSRSLPAAGAAPRPPRGPG